MSRLAAYRFQYQDMKMLAIFAHPGHELLISQILTDTKSTVCWLSDGSGGSATDRSAYTEMLLTKCGCKKGPIARFATDRSFYQAMMDIDVNFFVPIVETLSLYVDTHAPSVILTDPIEYFNPLHDLVNTITDIVIQRSGQKITKLVYPNEFPALFPIEQAFQIRHLTTEETKKKRAHLDTYTPLKSEKARFEEEGKLDSLALESVFNDPIRLDKMQRPHETKFETAFYEEAGKQAVANGLYKNNLTFSNHVFPLVKALVFHFLK